MPNFNKIAFEVAVWWLSKYDKNFNEIYEKMRDYLCEKELRNFWHGIFSIIVKVKRVVARRWFCL